MIYTRFGVKVIIQKYNPRKEEVTIRDYIDCSWVSKRHISELRADGGCKEIDDAIKQITNKKSKKRVTL